jgi:hypothetical protein
MPTGPTTSSSAISHADPPRRLLTFASGGWVLLLAVIVSGLLIAWAVGPVILGIASRPPGDGRTIESYRFDLEPLTVPRELIVAALPHREAVPRLDDPGRIVGRDMKTLNRERGKYVLDNDRVVGVVVNGEARAYPITVLNVHEVVNDELGGVPIAVTYHWPCDSVMVFDRRVDGRTLTLAVSGLLYNSNHLLYDRGASADEVGGESLWSQLLARAVSGPDAEAGARLDVLPATLTSWVNWLATHPETTVIDRDPTMVKRRYSKANPAQYFLLGKVVYPAEPGTPEDGPPPLMRSIMVETGGVRRVYPLLQIKNRLDENDGLEVVQGGQTLRFDYDRPTDTVIVTSTTGDTEPFVRHSLWFAWHAMHPDDELATFLD